MIAERFKGKIVGRLKYLYSQWAKVSSRERSLADRPGTVPYAMILIFSFRIGKLRSEERM